MHLLMVAEQLRRTVPGGIGTYLRGLVRGLAALGPEAPELTLWASRRPARGPDAVRALAGRMPVVTSPLPGRALVMAWDRGVGDLPVAADVVHAPSLTVPPAGNRPLTVTVHDVAWQRHPEAYTPRGRRWHDAALRRVVAQARVLIVPSEATAEALEAAGVDPERIEVIPEGSDHLPPPDHDAAALLLTRLGVPGRFLLSVSTLEPRKNLGALVAAFASARARFPEPWSLLVVGPAGWGSATPAAQEGVFLAGRVDDATLSALYERALAVAYVPLLEGFGLPPVEAMRAGTPVVASPMPSIGSAALVVDPLDVAAISDGLVRATTDDRTRTELVGSGRRHTERLTWVATARRHVAVWERLC